MLFVLALRLHFFLAWIRFKFCEKFGRLKNFFLMCKLIRDKLYLVLLKLYALEVCLLFWRTAYIIRPLIINLLNAGNVVNLKLIFLPYIIFCLSCIGYFWNLQRYSLIKNFVPMGLEGRSSINAQESVKLFVQQKKNLLEFCCLQKEDKS